MRKAHRDFVALFEEKALIEHLRHRNPVIMLRQEIETEQGVGEVFTVSEMLGIERLRVNRPKAIRDALLQRLREAPS
jgi:hypothetical protein